jgi:hypothetical protein
LQFRLALFGLELAFRQQVLLLSAIAVFGLSAGEGELFLLPTQGSLSLRQLGRIPLETGNDFLRVVTTEEPESLLAGGFGDSVEMGRRVRETGLVGLQHTEHDPDSVGELPLRQAELASSARDSLSELGCLVPCHIVLRGLLLSF